MDFNFNILAPEPPLTVAIKTFFSMEFNNPEERTDALLPDGLPSLLYLQTDHPIKVYFNKSGQPIELQNGGFYVGYSNVGVSMLHRQFKVYGVSIFPVYFSMIFGKSPLDIINRFCSLEEIGITPPSLGTDGAEPISFEETCMILSEYISERLSKHQENKEFVKMFEKLTAPGGHQQSLDTLAADLGCSTRHLRSRFTHFFGMSPKKFMKVIRFNQALKYIYDPTVHMSLASIAQEAGYHDQSHLIRDFKAICGKTPKEIATEMSPLPNKFRLFE